VYGLAYGFFQSVRVSKLKETAMMCCNKKMISVLDFALFMPSLRCELCFGSGDFYLSDGEFEPDGCECVSGAGPKKRFLECAICMRTEEDNTRKIAESRIRSHLNNLLTKKDPSIVFRIESLFCEGMSWESRKEWHVDHIRPIKSFLDANITDCNIINDPLNLQPLWAKDNLAKGATYE